MTILPMLTKYGNKAKNQRIVIDDNGNEYFYSYNRLCACKVKSQLYMIVIIDPVYAFYSQTTSFYRCQFLGERIADTRQKIKSGDYITTDIIMERVQEYEI